MRFIGFRESFKKSNMDGILARDLNIPIGSNDSMDMVSPGGAIQFKGRQLKSLNKILGLDDDVAMKTIRVINRNKFGIQIEDITGGCDKEGLNTGRDFGFYAGRPMPHAPCSPTNGKKWWVSAKDWDHVRMPLPPGDASGGGMGGGMGGGLGGGMGSAPPSTPPPGGGSSPPPPPG